MARGEKKRGKEERKREVLAEVIKLFREAKEVAREGKFGLADRYVKIAREMAMRVNLRFPSELKRQFCKHCNCYLYPGKNCRVRVAKKMVIYYCQKCKKFSRFGIRKKERKSR
jgi:ribonuclease P protein subunit RPR2